MNYNAKAASKAEASRVFKDSEGRLKVVQEQFDKVTRENNVATEVFSRQASYLQILTRKVEQLGKKKAAIEITIESDLGDWAKSKADAEEERAKALAAKKKQEDEQVLAEEMMRMEELKQRLERKAKEMEQIEAERLRLEEESKRELEEMKKAEASIKAKISGSK